MSAPNKIVNGVSLVLVRGDITEQDTDAIVNAANSSLLGGGGVDGAIHRAGGPDILEECRAIRARQGQCRPGQAVITSGGKLKAKWVIHTVGPIWRGGNFNEAETLASAYWTSLQLAFEAGARTVSFPSISTGAYGYPIPQAASVALGTVKKFLEQEESGPEGANSFDELRFVLFGQDAYDQYREVCANLT